MTRKPLGLPGKAQHLSPHHSQHMCSLSPPPPSARGGKLRIRLDSTHWPPFPLNLCPPCMPKSLRVPQPVTQAQLCPQARHHTEWDVTPRQEYSGTPACGSRALARPGSCPNWGSRGEKLSAVGDNSVYPPAETQPPEATSALKGRACARRPGVLCGVFLPEMSQTD